MRIAHWGLLHALAFSLALVPPTGGAELRTRTGKECRVKTDLKAKEAKKIVERIDMYCGHFAKFFNELGLKARNNNKAVVRIFSQYEDYESFALRTTSMDSAPAAFFSPSLNGIVAYHDDTDPFIRQVLFHEMSHQYINRYSSAVPKWANEGLAEYFEGWSLTPEGELIEKRPPFYDLLVVQKAWKPKKKSKRTSTDDEKPVEPLGLRELVEMEPKVFMNFPSEYPEHHRYLHYSTSWSLVYYFLEGPNEEDRQLFLDYLHNLNENNDRAGLIPVEDWDALEARWKEFMLSLEIEPESADDYQILASSHRQDLDYRQACEAYEKVLELRPETVGIHYWLGYCYKRRAKYDEATKHLELAIVEDEEDPRPLYQLSRIIGRFDRTEEQGDVVKALELAIAASKCRGDKSAFYLTFVARCHYWSGDTKNAKRTMRKVLKLLKDEDEDVIESYKKILESFDD